MRTTTANHLGIALAGVLALVSLPTRICASPPQFTVTDLGLSSSGNSYGWGLNSAGQVTGSLYNATGDFGDHAVVWTGTTPSDLGTLGGTNSYGRDINDSGMVAGFAFIASDGTYHGVRWSGTTAEDLGFNSYGFGINSLGQIAGESGGRAVVWTGTIMTDLLRGPGSYAEAINDSGQVAVQVGSHAVRWSQATVEDFGADSYGADINATGQVAGQLGSRAAVWTGITPTDLGTLGGNSSFATGINDLGDVVGFSNTADSPDHAFLFSQGVMYDLNSLLMPDSGITYLRVNDINNFGQIVAWGTIGGQPHALLITPTPEPASGALLLGGAALLGLRRKR